MIATSCCIPYYNQVIDSYYPVIDYYNPLLRFVAVPQSIRISMNLIYFKRQHSGIYQL